MYLNVSPLLSQPEATRRYLTDLIRLVLVNNTTYGKIDSFIRVRC